MLIEPLGENQYKQIIEEIQKERDKLIIADSTPSNRVLHNLLKSNLEETFKDSKNFIFELIQNADDQEATKIDITLDKNQVIFAHNSNNPFTKKDLERISNIAKDEKKNEPKKIGQKGIGFKNVFKITKYPKIFCGHLRFIFKHSDMGYRLIYPNWLDNEPRKDDEFTYFILNFDLEDVGYDLVKESLELINSKTLMFLNNIQSISLKDNIKNTDVSFFREYVKNPREYKYYKTGIIDNKSLDEKEIKYFHLFSKEISKEEVKSEGWERENNPKIGIAIEVDDSNVIMPKKDSSCDLYVYLPTKLNLGFKFILHGDFDTEVDRKDITDPGSSRFNQIMLNSVASLFDEIVKTYKKDNQNNIKFLELIPQERDDNNSIFRIIQKSICELLNSKEIFLVERDKELFQVGCKIHEYIPEISIESSDFLGYYAANKTDQEVLSSQIKDRALDLFHDFSGLNPNFDLILNVLEFTAKTKKEGWFLELYSKLSNYMGKFGFEKKDIKKDIKEKIQKKKLILTKDNQLVNCEKTVFHYKKIEYPDIEEVKPLFYDTETIKDVPEEVKQFISDVLKICDFDLSEYFTDYLLPWVTKENLTNKEAEFHKILKYLFKNFQENKLQKINFEGTDLYLLDRNNEAQSQQGLFLGTDYKKNGIESIFDMCEIKVPYLNKKYLDILLGDTKEKEKFFIKIGVNNIIPAKLLGSFECKYPIYEKDLPSLAKYKIEEKDCKHWDKTLVDSQKIHSCIYRCNNYTSIELKKIFDKIESLKEIFDKEKKIKNHITYLLTSILDENWNIYSKKLYCDIYYNQNNTKNTRWNKYYKSQNTEKLSDFGRLIKSRLMLPNKLDEYCKPYDLYITNSDPKKELKLDLSSEDLIKFLGIQGTPSISDTIDRLKALKKENGILQDPKKTYLEFYAKIKDLKNNEEKEKYILEINNLIFLPLQEKWFVPDQSNLFFDDEAKIYEPTFSTVTSQFDLRGKEKENLKKLFKNIREKPLIDDYMAVLVTFHYHKKLNSDDLELIKKLVGYLAKSDSDVLKNTASIPNNDNILLFSNEIYYSDIPLSGAKLDSIIPNKDFNELVIDYQEKLNIENISDHLKIMDCNEHHGSEDFSEKLRLVNQTVFYIKEIIKKDDSKEQVDDIYKKLKIKLVTSINLQGPNNVELTSQFFYDKKNFLILINADKINEIKLIDFVSLFIKRQKYDKMFKIKNDIEWTCNLAEESNFEGLNKLLSKRGYHIIDACKQIPVINQKNKEIIRNQPTAEKTSDSEIYSSKQDSLAQNIIEKKPSLKGRKPVNRSGSADSNKIDYQSDKDLINEIHYHVAELESIKKTIANPFTYEELVEKCKNPASDIEERDEITAELTRIQRNKEYGKAVKQIYEDKCAVCGLRMYDLKGNPEAQWAHIKPVRKPHKGPDDIRNGLALCRLHHWAFDKGLFDLSDQLKIIVKENLLKNKDYECITKFSGKIIFTPDHDQFKPELKFVRYHREHIFQHNRRESAQAAAVNQESKVVLPRVFIKREGCRKDEARGDDKG